MEKKVASFEKYEIFIADQLCLDEISRFIVKENYVHHLKTKSEPRLDADIFDVFTEENYLYSPNSKIYIARTYKGQIIGCSLLKQHLFLPEREEFSNSIQNIHIFWRPYSAYS